MNSAEISCRKSFVRPYLRPHFFARLRQATALVLMLGLVAGTFVGGSAHAQQAQIKKLNEEQRIIHVLNRLGFGPRPGDIERVRKVGLERYIEQQLDPAKIDDAAVEAKLRDLSTLRMSTAELFAKHPQPGDILRRLQREGKVPRGDLAALAGGQQNMNKAAAGDGNATKMPDAVPMPDSTMPKAKTSDAAMSATNGSGGMPAMPDAAGKGDRDDYRQVVRQYYIDNNLQVPQRITEELQSARILRAVYSERQLQEVMVDFWSNHFNVFVGKGADRWLLTAYDRDVIRPNALTKFADLLRATAQSPAMLFYLDNYQSVSPNSGNFNRRGRQAIGAAQQFFNQGVPAQRPEMANSQERRVGKKLDKNPGKKQPPSNGEAMPPSKEMNTSAQMQAVRQRLGQQPRRGINENYARELMELHTLGVDGGYTQKDIQEVARCFTGWTIFNPRGYNLPKDAQKFAESVLNTKNGEFFFNPRAHDDGEKMVLGHRIPAGGGINDGLMVLDILSKHPSTAKFIATKLARRFVTDNPTPALVERVAAAFTKSNGDIKEVLRTIFSSPEFNSPAAYRAKIKTPFEVVISAIRALGAETNGGPAIQQWIAQMGEPLYGYQAPTGYPDTSEAWVSTGALLSRVNFALALASNRIKGTRVPLAELTKADGNSTSNSKAATVDRLMSLVLYDNVSPKTKATIIKQLEEPLNMPAKQQETNSMPEQPDREMRARGKNRRNGVGGMPVELAASGNAEVARMIGLILGTPEFQRQ